jgi:hypothetical protein
MLTQHKETADYIIVENIVCIRYSRTYRRVCSDVSKAETLLVSCASQVQFYRWMRQMAQERAPRLLRP